MLPTFKRALEISARYVSQFLDVAAGHLGLDHNRVLMGRYAFPVICRMLHLAGGHFADSAETGRVLYWYLHSALWGRYAGSAETVLNQDYDTASRSGVGGLISSLERWRGGNLVIDGRDFEGSGRGSRFYPLLYLLTRTPRCPGLRQRPATAQPSAGPPRQCPNPPHLSQNGSI